MKFPLICLLGSLLMWSVSVFAQSFNETAWEKRTTVKTLDNGFTIVIVERPMAPVFSYSLRVDVGSAQEQVGQTGLAHMFEHMASKGTPSIGTNNDAQEKVAIQKIEEAYQAYRAEREKVKNQNIAKLAELKHAWESAIKAADQYVKPNEFKSILQAAGCVGINASTDTDRTNYSFSCPSNAFELWAYLESERLLHPVLRQFYQERNVVIEERNQDEDSDPNDKLSEQFYAAAFMVHPYHHSPSGWRSDLDSLSMTDAEAFRKKYYVPANIVLTVVGKLDPQEAFPILEAYFGRLPKGPKPSTFIPQEPKQEAERKVVLFDHAHPFFYEGYHAPGSLDPQFSTSIVLANILAKGRTSRLYKHLVQQKKIAISVGAYPFSPGRKYPGLFTFYGKPLQGHTIQEVQIALHKELEQLQKEEVSEKELHKVKLNRKADLFWELTDNARIANLFSEAVQLYGDWHEIFRRMQAIENVSAADVKHAAKTLFNPENRTTAWIQNPGITLQK